MSELSPRVSDADRDRAVQHLREHLVEGRLTLEEFSERVELAYRARSADELAVAGDSLPAVRGSGRRRRAARITAALFAHVVRRGRLRLPRLSAVLSVFSDVDLDLRDAQVARATASVATLVAFGNVDVYVPEGVEVDLVGLTVFGHRREWGRDPARGDAPLVRVWVLALFGTVDVWRVPADQRGDYGEITRALQAGQRELPAAPGR